MCSIALIYNKVLSICDVTGRCHLLVVNITDSLLRFSDAHILLSILESKVFGLVAFATTTIVEDNLRRSGCSLEAHSINIILFTIDSLGGSLLKLLSRPSAKSFCIESVSIYLRPFISIDESSRISVEHYWLLVFSYIDNMVEPVIIAVTIRAEVNIIVAIGGNLTILTIVVTHSIGVIGLVFTLNLHNLKLIGSCQVNIEHILVSGSFLILFELVRTVGLPVVHVTKQIVTVC